MESLRALGVIEISRAKKEGMIEVTCPSCDKTNYIMDFTPPVLCSCGKDLTERIAKMTKSKDTQTSV